MNPCCSCLCGRLASSLKARTFLLSSHPFLLSLRDTACLHFQMGATHFQLQLAGVPSRAPLKGRVPGKEGEMNSAAPSPCGPSRTVKWAWGGHLSQLHCVLLNVHLQLKEGLTWPLGGA